ncbi:TetR/AcrR family transcriptional regulator [Hyphomicrobium sp.]|uniref:TetR/AcrR family transcriptional regulator n=1 Tax=Hyphomicrobium sp. TaxID=82 RepID=UPI0025C4B4E3|nr:TetR/AcrR family transcriptional regulator [Hyphomicrobium sp.]MCC7251867.1 TetR family transcriptional regulator [Hyphomicrobium sp.]
MSRASAAQQAASTRERILDAAVQRFSRRSYEETGLRDIAADVGVDVAYVHRCFGSKEKLFAEAVRVALKADRSFPDDSRELGRALARQALARDGKHSHGRTGSLDIVIRSLSSPQAAAVLREFIVADFITPLSRHVDQPSLRRASLIMAFLAGLGILRNVLDVASLREAGGGELEAMIACIIQLIIAAPASGRA